MDIRDPYWPLGHFLLADFVTAFVAEHPRNHEGIVIDDTMTIFPPVQPTFQSPYCVHFSRPGAGKGSSHV